MRPLSTAELLEVSGGLKKDGFEGALMASVDADSYMEFDSDNYNSMSSGDGPEDDPELPEPPEVEWESLGTVESDGTFRFSANWETGDEWSLNLGVNLGYNPFSDDWSSGIEGSFQWNNTTYNLSFGGSDFTFSDGTFSLFQNLGDGLAFKLNLQVDGSNNWSGGAEFIVHLP